MQLFCQSRSSCDDREGQFFHCPLPSVSFTAFSCLLLCPTSTLTYTEALRTDQCLTSREQCLIEIGDDVIPRMVLNSRFASGQLRPDLLFLFIFSCFQFVSEAVSILDAADMYNVHHVAGCFRWPLATFFFSIVTGCSYSGVSSSSVIAVEVMHLFTVTILQIFESLPCRDRFS